MITFNSAVDAYPANAPSVAAIHARAYVQEPHDPARSPYVLIYDGTGACTTLEFFQTRYTYPLFATEAAKSDCAPDAPPTYADLMNEVRDGFGRTLSRLTSVFGVSRRTLYNWIEGETPKETHRPKLTQLAAAAREFQAAGFTPTADVLDWALMRDKSFLELLEDGEQGAPLAKKLMRVVEHERTAKARLEQSLADAPDIEADVLEDGARAYREDA